MTDLAPDPQDLDSLAHEINRTEQLAEDHFHDSIAYALRVGELLLEAKAALPHGAWLTWLVANTRFAPRTAQERMQFAEEVAASNTRPGAHLGFKNALKAVTRPQLESGEPPAATTDLSDRLREARAVADRSRDDDPAALRDLDAAREKMDRHMRRARRRDCERGERGEAWRAGAAVARRLGEMMDALAQI